MEQHNMTPYIEETKQDDSVSNSSVPAVSLLDFAEEVLRQPENQPSKSKRTASAAKR
jgi:hypothetical protein